MSDNDLREFIRDQWGAAKALEEKAEDPELRQYWMGQMMMANVILGYLDANAKGYLKPSVRLQPGADCSIVIPAGTEFPKFEPGPIQFYPAPPAVTDPFGQSVIPAGWKLVANRASAAQGDRCLNSFGLWAEWDPWFNDNPEVRDARLWIRREEKGA